MNAHGYVRLTYDVDLVIHPTPDNIQTAFTALAGLGYRPSVPVTANRPRDLDDIEHLRIIIEEKRRDESSR